MENFYKYADLKGSGFHNPHPYMPQHPARIAIVGGSGYGKTNLLLNQMWKGDNIDKVYVCAKDTKEPLYRLLGKLPKNAVKLVEELGILGGVEY